MPKDVRILHLEDDPHDAELVKALLEKSNLSCSLTRVDNPADYAKALETDSWDLILADYKVPGFDAESALLIARQKCPDRPFIFLSGTMGEELAIGTLKMGATDYVLKQRLSRLVPAVERALKEAQERFERLHTENALQAIQDQLGHVIASSPAIVYSAKVEGTAFVPTWISANATWILDYSLEQMLTPDWWHDHVHPDDRETAVAKSASLLGRKHITHEYRFQKANGAHFWVRDEMRLLSDAAGNPIEVVGSWSDISERKQIEAQLYQSQSQLRALAARLQSAREEQNTRISQELHDELGQALTGVKMDASWIERQLANMLQTELPQKWQTRLKSMTELIDTMIRQVRRICAELRPSLLDDLGLVAAVEWQTGEFRSRSGISCSLSLPEDLRLEGHIVTAVFRIYQEILTNIARHAGASHVSILLCDDQDDLFLEVSDNGRGITEQETTNSQSLGLLGMRERALAVGGSVVIQGWPGKGTTVTVRVPV